MRLRLRVTGEGLKITGSSPGFSVARPLPPGQPALVTENGDLLVTQNGERLAAEPFHGQ
jgi:hypothetical protein